MRKPKLKRFGSDLDDCLIDCFDSVTRFHNERYGTNHLSTDIRSWHLEHLWGCSEAEAVRRVAEWFDSPSHDTVMPLPGAQAAIARLAIKRELCVISGRPSCTQEKSEQMVRRHFWASFAAGVHLTDQFGERRRSKGDVCRELGVTHYVEDSPTHARDLLAAGVTVLLLDKPWNREFAHEDIIRVYSWAEVERYLHAIS